MTQAIVPREAAVHVMLGRLHKRLRDPDAALTAFNTALDLQPGAAERAGIKAAIDKLHLAEDEEDEEL
jgi:anaphase-promoting complex subunit 3